MRRPVNTVRSDVDRDHTSCSGRGRSGKISTKIPLYEVPTQVDTGMINDEEVQYWNGRDLDEQIVTKDADQMAET